MNPFPWLAPRTARHARAGRNAPGQGIHFAGRSGQPSSSTTDCVAAVGPGARQSPTEPMTKHFLLSIDLPDWADKPDRMEMIREEIEQHGGACAAFYTNATHVTALCRNITPPYDINITLAMATPLGE